MNNRSSGRRRGRSNRSPNRGPNDGNRQNSRNPGNAHQLCEKYKNMARDAHQQGDRVMNEYYLQFADHYFRILAEANNRKEEQQREREEAKKAKADKNDADKNDGADNQGGKDQDDSGKRGQKRGAAKGDDKPDAEDKPKKRGRPPKKKDEEANGAADDARANGAETIEADRLPGAIAIDGDDTAEDKPKRKSPSRSRARKSGDDDAAAA